MNEPRNPFVIDSDPEHYPTQEESDPFDLYGDAQMDCPCQEEDDEE